MKDKTLRIRFTEFLVKVKTTADNVSVSVHTLISGWTLKLAE